MSKKWVYMFEEGGAGDKNLLGGKGANLAEMTNIGLPVPYGFTISTETCSAYNAGGRQYPADLQDQATEALERLQDRMGKYFGSAKSPLLVSVRSGAPVSMPGMMDTILNLGLNDQTVLALAEQTGDARFAWDCYRRFILMFANVVLHVDKSRFDRILHHYKEEQHVTNDYELSAAHLQQVVADSKALVKKEAGRDFPQEPLEQLDLAIRAVFDSWDNPRARIYRQLHKIPDSLGTAVNVMSMVFGNMGMNSGTGVVFTRNPNTGVKEFYGEYLLNAQGEDVVAGVRTPQPIAILKSELPAVYDQLFNVCELLEQHYTQMQDIEFTVERGKLYMLQCRTGKSTAAAAVKIAVDMVHEGKTTREQALLRVDAAQIEKLLHRAVDPTAKLDIVAVGLAASPGAASGLCVFDPDKAERWAHEGKQVVLVRQETNPDDIHGMIAAQGVLTSRGGMTCHAAIVARGMGKPCIVGCEQVHIDMERGSMKAGDRVVHEGDLISIDGGTGNVIVGGVPLVDPQLSPEFRVLLGWADDVRTTGVRTNADTPEDAVRARDFGAEGVGLCRTEHMFMAQDRLPAVKEMILAEAPEERREALAKLLPMQQQDFYGIFKAMAGLPVTIRLLDPPLHEFLPNKEELTVEVAVLRATGGSERELANKELLLRKVRQLSEFNPMLGFRGCRLGIIYPEISEMQARALFQAVAQLRQEGIEVQPEVMVPLVGHVNELKLQKEVIDAVARAVMSEQGVTISYKVGTMIEVPRAALTAAEIAEVAEFFSFGTNDLTQTTFGYSRDDAEGKFLTTYVQQKVLPENPFVSLDTHGVGRLIDIAVTDGRRARPDLKVGICGEHGGDPASIAFCVRQNFNYVSCSPFRVPVARLAAAQATLQQRGQ